MKGKVFDWLVFAHGWAPFMLQGATHRGVLRLAQLMTQKHTSHLRVERLDRSGYWWDGHEWTNEQQMLNGGNDAQR